MQLLKLSHPTYRLLRRILTAAGLSKPLRMWLGPLAGRTVSRFTSDPNQPSLVRGHSMILTNEGSYPPIAMAIDQYEEGTTRLFQSLVKPGMVVIDVGAHVGYYSLLAAKHVGPTGKVYAFEPEPRNHKLLLSNIERNGYTNIVPINKGVSNRVGSTTLFLTALDNGRHSAYRHRSPERGSVSVEATTIDDFLDAQGWPKVDLVKVDVEGAEMDVLQGMDRLFHESPDLKLIVEYNPTYLQDASADPLEFLGNLSARDFKINCIVEKDGPVELPEEERALLVDKLLKSEGAVNLYCTKD